MADVFDTDHDYQVFATLSGCRLAVDVVIASAQRDLHVFDTDLFDIAFDDLARYELFAKIETLQEGMNRFHGAKGMAILVITTLIGVGAMVAEWVRLGLRGHS